MKQKGSQQWQDGYPFRETIEKDILQGEAYLVEERQEAIAYVAISHKGEPTYAQIDGKWLNEGPYTVVHRIATSEKAKGKRLGAFIMKKTEEISIKNHIFSIKADTNFDNYPMKRILEKEGYTYCGIIQVRDGKERLSKRF